MEKGKIEGAQIRHGSTNLKVRFICAFSEDHFKGSKEILIFLGVFE